jgi:hypothetical protein
MAVAPKAVMRPRGSVETAGADPVSESRFVFMVGDWLLLAADWLLITGHWSLAIT